MKKTLLIYLTTIAAVAGAIFLARHEAQPPVEKPKSTVEPWASNRYHFVNMRSMTEETYTMICDRHTGYESLLAKGYQRNHKTGQDTLISMAQVSMGFSPDCLNRDVNAYMNRKRSP